MELCEFKASLVVIVSSGQPGLYSEDISSKKEKEEREEGRKEEKKRIKLVLGNSLGIVALDKIEHYEESQADAVKPQGDIAEGQTALSPGFRASQVRRPGNRVHTAPSLHFCMSGSRTKTVSHRPSHS